MEKQGDVVEKMIAKEDDFMETQEDWKMESTFFLVIVSKIPPRSLIQKASRGSSA